MDHDNLVIPTQPGVLYHPAKILPGTISDEFHVIGYNSRTEPLVGTVDHLRFIYRIDDQTAQSHWLLLKDSMARAYRKTRHMLATSPGLKRIFPEEFISSSDAWDARSRSTWDGPNRSVLPVGRSRLTVSWSVTEYPATIASVT